MNLSRTYILQFILFAVFALFFSISGTAAQRDFYQIQIFRLTGKTQEDKVNNFLEKAYLPALHRAGIEKVGVFKPIENDTTSGKRIYVWIPFKSLDHFAKIQGDLENDRVYQAAGIDFLGAPFDNIPFIRKESILLKAFSDAPEYFIPSFKTNSTERIYELRSY